jgi:hypothetical protein
MSRLPEILLVSVLLASLPLNRAVSDIAPSPLTGGHPVFRHGEGTTDVRMVEEDVVVRLYADSIVTVASFAIQNEGETIEMEVGFPFAYRNDVMRFRAFVDGRPVAVHDGQEERSDPKGRKRRTVYWKLWDTTFQEGEGCAIRVEYKTKPFVSHFPVEELPSLPADVLETMRRATTINTVEYTLGTGKSWKGVLDHCKLSFELVGMSAAHINHCSPDGYAVAENRVVWEYTDYEPRGGVILTYCPYMPLHEIPEVLRGIVERFPNDPLVASAAGRFCDSPLGRGDAMLEIYHSFLARWNEPIPQLMEYAPGSRCRFDFEAGNHFFTVWRMARILFERCQELQAIERCRDIAPTVSRISGAIVDSLDTCGGLPSRDARLFGQAKELLDLSNGLIKANESPTEQ